jgi:death on curing protein
VTDLEYLELDDLLALVRALKTGPVRDVGLIDSAAARPRATAFGEPAYPTLPLQAAALLQSLVGNHALVDGNKRLGWLATVVFLDLNACEPKLTDDEAFQLVMDVAAGSVELEEIAERLRVRPR